MLVMMCFLCVSEEKFDHDPENPFDQIELDDNTKIVPDNKVNEVVWILDILIVLYYYKITCIIIQILTFKDKTRW